MSLWVVVGGQYGSEGKGKIAAYLTRREDIDICVRCGGPNSGHSFYDDEGRFRVLRQLPTGFINPRTRLLIPAGALIDPGVLVSELALVPDAEKRIGIDRNTFIIEDQDREYERTIGLRERLSSTLCGVGAAQSRRVLRGADSKLARDAVRDYPWLQPLLTNVSEEVNEALDYDKKVLIEGTQGFGLSLYHSPHYPRTTSRDVTASAFLSEVGVSPLRVTDIVLVLRTFPIRVAGDQAGPLKDEITWEQLRAESGYPHDITEMTSVTNKIRRVARFDWELAAKAAQINSPTMVAINGLDYIEYSNRGIIVYDSMTLQVRDFLQRLETALRVPITMFGTGPSVQEVTYRHASDSLHDSRPRAYRKIVSANRLRSVGQS
jgi:adenylosuccinate synthase